MKSNDDGQVPNDHGFSVYRNFATKHMLSDFCAILEQHEIPFRTSGHKSQLDQSLMGTGLPLFAVEIMRKDFGKANEIVATSVLSEAEETDLSEHHLNELTDQELRDIITKPDMWAYESVIISKELLRQRGIEVSTNEVQESRKTRLSEARKPREVSQSWILFYALLGVMSGIWFLFIWGLLAAVGMGVYYFTGRETNVDGNRYPIFGSTTQNGGLIIIVSSIVGFLVGFFYWRGAAVIGQFNAF